MYMYDTRKIPSTGFPRFIAHRDRGPRAYNWGISLNEAIGLIALFFISSTNCPNSLFSDTYFLHFKTEYINIKQFDVFWKIILKHD